MSDPVDFIQLNETHPEKIPPSGRINLFWHKLTGKIGFKRPDGSTSVLEPVDNSSVVAAIEDGPSAAVTALSTITATAATTINLTAADSGKILRCTSGSAVTINMPSTDPGGNFSVAVIRAGAGTVTFAANGKTLNSYNSLLAIAGQHAWASLIRVDANTYNLSGNLA